MRILVAEDDPALGSFVRKGLEAEHYAVDVSADGEQARAMAGELDFDLVVLDLNLPRLDGVSILRFLRTRKPSMPILVLTGRTRVEDRVQCLDLGADDYLGKPFSFTELSARIRALMRRSHLPAESGSHPAFPHELYIFVTWHVSAPKLLTPGQLQQNAELCQGDRTRRSRA